MRGFGFRDHGGPERLEFVEVPPPLPNEGEVRIRVEAASFNRLDRFTLAGIPGVVVQRPHILGSAAAGVVEMLGPGTSAPPGGTRVLVNPGISDGTCEACRRGEEPLCRNFRILGEHTQGSATEFVVVPARNVYPLPERLSFAEGAAAPLVFETAWRALATVGAVRPGDRVAIIGAGGGVATAAIQIAKHLGAHVAVVTRSPDKAEKAIALGADTGLIASEERAHDRLLWEWSGKQGIDVIFDSVGAPSIPRSLKAVARGGRIVVIGATAGPLAEIDLRTLFWRQASIRGSTMASSQEFAAVLSALASGALRPVIDGVYSFSRAVEAFHRFDSADLFGKIVLSPTKE